MKSTLYSQFQDCFSNQETYLLDAFKQREFWEDLEEEDQEKLAKLFLLKAEKLAHDETGELSEASSEESLMESLHYAETLAPSHPHVLCRIAALLFHRGRISQNPQLFFLALTKLGTAEKVDPGFFEAFFEWSHLWANILVALSGFVNEEGVLERALQKFEKAEALLKQESKLPVVARDLYWDWAEAWTLLGKRSGELADVLQGIEKFKDAARLGCDLPHFCIDYGDALFHLGLLRGDPKVLVSALDFFKEAIALCLLYESTGIPQGAFRKGWCSLVATALKLAEMTGSEEDFRAADQFIHEAVLAIPSHADFWLDWGALYLAHGWIHKTVGSIEIALEKLTSSKIVECDPLQVSCLLGEGLILLGLFLEELKFIKEGERRILETLKFAPNDSGLLYGAGLASLALGLYFSDEHYFQSAVEQIQKGIALHAASPKLWHVLFQTYMSWGTVQSNGWVLRKGLAAAARLVELWPYSPHYWSGWGIGYLRLYQVDKDDFMLLEESAAKLRKALELREHPEADWLFYYAYALDLLGDHYGDESYYEQAIVLFSQVLETVPQAVNVRYHLAIALSHHGEMMGEVESLQRAHDLFQSIIKVDEEDDGAWCEWGYLLLNLAELLEDRLHPEQGERFRALAEAKLVHAAKLGSGIAHYHLACLYSLAGLTEAAITSLKRAEDSDALPPLEDLEQDERLECIRQSVSFQEFLSLRKQQEFGF